MNGDPEQLGALVTAVDRIEFDATGVVEIGSGSVIATGGDASEIELGAGSLTIAGSLLAGVTIDNGNTTFSGVGAKITVTGRDTVAIGGQGIINGVPQAVGGTLAATGDIAVNVHGGVADVSFTLSPSSSLRTETATNEPAGISHNITIDTDQDIQIYNAIDASHDGADVTLTSGELIVVDGLLKADNRLTVTGGRDETGVGLIVNAFEFDANDVRLQGGTLSTYSGGTISIGADDKVVLSGIVGEVHDVAGIPVVDTYEINVTRAGNVMLMGAVNAANSIQFQATDITLAASSVIRTHAADGWVNLQATGTFLIGASSTASQPALVQADALVRLLGGTLSLDGQIVATGSTSQIEIDAVDSVTFFGTVNAADSLDVQAGGDVTINGGTLTSGGDSNIAADHDVTVVGVTSVGSELVPVLRPVIVTTPRTIEIVTGTRQVAIGSILVPEVTFVTTTTTEQVGTESVRVGSTFNTADVSLTQLGYYNPDETPAKRYREYFVEGVDYHNSSIDWSKTLDPLSGDVVVLPVSTPPVAGTQFGALLDPQRNAVLIALGYRKFYDTAFAALQTHNTINGIPTTQTWQPDWYNATESASVVGAWNASGNPTDSAGEGLNGVLHGGVTYTPGRAGLGFAFDGAAGTAVLIPDHASLQTNIGTIDAWIRTSDTSAEFKGIVVKQFAYGLFVANGGKLVAYDWAANVIHDTGHFVADGQFHHVAMSFQSGVTNGTVIYIDGDAVLTATTSVASHVGYGLAIGSGHSNTGQDQNFNGVIDEVHIWDRALTSSEVAGIVPIASTVIGSSSLVASYPATENTDDIAMRGHNGMPLGEVTYAAGQMGTGFEFDGNSGTVVAVPNNEELKLSNGTIGAWIQTTDASPGHHGILVTEGEIGPFDGLCGDFGGVCF
ncbi:MAG: LamG domain-containing protein, partial [Planctomycetota bacterium]|nr:LamG domain-containing protein [Planctomycetota bacterium]